MRQAFSLFVYKMDGACPLSKQRFKRCNVADPVTPVLLCRLRV